MNPYQLQKNIEEVFGADTALNGQVLADTLVNERSSFPHIVFRQPKDTDVQGFFGHVSANTDEYLFEIHDTDKSNVGQLMNDIFNAFNAIRLGGGTGDDGETLAMFRVGGRGPNHTTMRTSTGDPVYLGSVRFRVLTQYNSNHGA